MDRKENVIKEQRTIEATKNNLMGPSGRLGTIVKVFGTAIKRQGGSLLDFSYMDDPYEDFAYHEFETTLSGQPGPLMFRDRIDNEEDESVMVEGFLFDGLSRGLHLEITYLLESHRLTVSYQGYEVYREVAGELEVYVPHADWENKIERLFRVAKKHEKVQKPLLEQELKREVESKKASFWEKMKKRWGV